MSGVINREPHYRDVVLSSNGYVLIDTRYTFDDFFETMVFRCDKDGNITKEEDWLEIDCERYPSAKEMNDGHKRMIEKWSIK